MTNPTKNLGLALRKIETLIKANQEVPHMDAIQLSDLVSAHKILLEAEGDIQSFLENFYSELVLAEDAAMQRCKIAEELPKHLCQGCTHDLLVNALLFRSKRVEDLNLYSSTLLAMFPTLDAPGGSQRP